MWRLRPFANNKPGLIHGPFIHQHVISAIGLFMAGASPRHHKEKPGMKSAVKPMAMVATLLAAAFCSSTLAQNISPVQQEKNRQLVINFYNDFFNRHEVDKAARVVAEDYRQHNPQVPDGKRPFVEGFRDYFRQNPNARARIVRSAVDGDRVWLHVHSTERDGDRGEAVVDIFRVRDGKIVEHWDVIQAVPDKAQNANTMF